MEEDEEKEDPEEELREGGEGRRWAEGGGGGGGGEHRGCAWKGKGKKLLSILIVRLSHLILGNLCRQEDIHSSPLITQTNQYGTKSFDEGRSRIFAKNMQLQRQGQLL